MQSPIALVLAALATSALAAPAVSPRAADACPQWMVGKGPSYSTSCCVYDSAARNCCTFGGDKGMLPCSSPWAANVDDFFHYAACQVNEVREAGGCDGVPVIAPSGRPSFPPGN